MKKPQIIVIAIIVVLIAIMLIAIAIAPHDELPGSAGRPYNCYELECVVVSCEQGMLFEDTTGNLWAMAMDGTAYTIGQHVLLQMDSCGTASVLDDVIVSVNGGAE